MPSLQVYLTLHTTFLSRITFFTFIRLRVWWPLRQTSGNWNLHTTISLIKIREKWKRREIISKLKACSNKIYQVFKVAVLLLQLESEDWWSNPHTWGHHLHPCLLSLAWWPLCLPRRWLWQGVGCPGHFGTLEWGTQCVRTDELGQVR